MSALQARVSNLLATAVAAFWGRNPLEAGTDELERLIRAGKLTDEALADIGARGAAAVDDVLARWTLIDALLREAAELEREANPGTGSYEARRRIVARFRGEDRERRQFNLKPDSRLAPGDGAPAPPPRDARYDHLFALTTPYWSDPEYVALAAMPAAELPDGALLAIWSLGRASDTGLRRGDEWGVTHDELLGRYGRRAFPAAVEFLSHPERYGWSERIGHNAVGTRWFPPPAGYFIAQVMPSWPAPEAEDVSRLYLEAGWNYVGGRLPDAPWARSLLAQFEASPYGRPDRPAWSR